MTVSKKSGIIWATLASVLAALFVIPWKLATNAGEITTVVFVLLLSAATANSLIWLATSHSKPFAKPTKLEMGLSSGLAVLTLLGNLASAKAIVYLTPASLNTFFRAEVIIISLLAMVFLKEAIERRFYLGLVVVGVGFYIMTPNHTLGDDWSVGVGFALIAATMFSGMVLLARKYVRRIDTVLVNALRLWISVIFWFLANWRIPGASEFNTSLVLYAVIAAIAGPVLGRMCFMFSSVHLEARKSALIAMTSPVFALGFSFIFLDDIPDNLEIWGGAIMLLGISFTLLPKGKFIKLKEIRRGKV
ncbi:MAG: DMT family transporter [Algicola sp.]|nr:DMT family transporter [Algicola sp.]